MATGSALALLENLARLQIGSWLFCVLGGLWLPVTCKSPRYSFILVAQLLLTKVLGRNCASAPLPLKRNERKQLCRMVVAKVQDDVFLMVSRPDGMFHDCRTCRLITEHAL